MSLKGRFRLIEAVGDEFASTSFSPKLLHRSKPPSSLHRKLRANLVRHDSKIWRRHTHSIRCPLLRLKLTLAGGLRTFALCLSRMQCHLTRIRKFLIKITLRESSISAK